MSEIRFFNQKRRRYAEFIKLPNDIKAKVGSGGLAEETLNKAQKILESNTIDFQPLGETYLLSLLKGVEAAKNIGSGDDPEFVISMMIYPAMQMKANGGMFHYPLVTRISAKLIQFLEVVEVLDIEALEIILGFYGALKSVISGRLAGHGGQRGLELLKALDDACLRYFEKNPEKNP